ncbi:unnamed protein product [Ectocarpus sp. CCAP 1310/34]|nr:unnamed protein product [Ectocarpus sp. CCAP 1310/34]
MFFFTGSGSRMLWLVNVLAYLINAVVVGGSNFGWWGATNAEVSDDNPTFVTPNGWAFSIWGVIFFFEAVFVIWGAFRSNRDSRVVQEGVGCWFAIACLIQAAWSIVFAQELLIVSAILLCLITLSLTLAVISLSLIQCEEGITLFTLPFWGVYFPIGLHGGWTLAAAIVNINVALELRGDTGSELAALILSLVGAALGAAFISLVFHNQPYLLAVAWAIAGIASKQDYRFVQLGKDLSDGVNVALQGLWIGLLCIGVLGILVGVRQMNRAEAEVIHKRRPIPSAPGNPADRDLTSAIYSS